MQLRLGFPLAIPSLPGSTGWLGLLWGCISRRAHDPGHPPAVSLCWEARPILQRLLPCPCPWAGDSRVDIRRRMLTLVSTSLTCLGQRWEKWVSHRQWWIGRMAVGPYLSSGSPSGSTYSLFRRSAAFGRDIVGAPSSEGHICPRRADLCPIPSPQGSGSCLAPERVKFHTQGCQPMC